MQERCIAIELFIRPDSERCAEAQAFVEELVQERPGLRLVVRDVVNDKRNLARFYKIAEAFDIAKPGLPAFYLCRQFELGWESVEITGEELRALLRVEVFVRAGCPRCAAGKEFLRDVLRPQYPGFEFVIRDIVDDSAARERMQELARQYGTRGTSVPGFHACGKLLIGFSGRETTGAEWERLLHGATLLCNPPPPAEEEEDRQAQEIGRPGPHLVRERTISNAVLRSPPTWPTAVPPRQPTWLHLASQSVRDQEVETATTDEAPPPSDEAPALDEAPPQDAAPGLDEAPPLNDVPSLEEAPPPPEDELPVDELALPDELPLASPADEPQTSTGDAEDDFRALPLVGRVNWRAMGLPAFTLLVGLIDGFNPCAMWVLLFLLSLLVNLKNRAKILAVAGTFVFISGAAYFAFMAAWLNVLGWIGFLRPAQIVLGLIGTLVGLVNVKDFFAFKQGLSFSIPESAKPAIYARSRKIVLAESLFAAIAGASVLAVLVNFIELLCTAGLPTLYTGVLTLQQLPAWKEYAYLLLYIAAYMFDDSVMVGIVVVTLGKTKLQERGGRWLKLLSGAVILALGLVMIFRPQLLE